MTIFCVLNSVKAVFPLVCLLMSILSCDEDGRVSKPVTIVPDYHLVFGPAQRNDPFQSYYVVYSSRSSSIVDSSEASYWMMSDFVFTNDGALLIFSGYYNTIPRGPNAVWAVDYKSKNSISRREGFFLCNMKIDPADAFILGYGCGRFDIATLPGLDDVYSDSIGAVIGGFLNEDNKAYYLVDGIDSINVVDFRNVDSIKTRQYPVRFSIAGRNYLDGITDYKRKRLYVLIGDSASETSALVIYDSETCEKLNARVLPHSYRSLFLRPDGSVLYLVGYGSDTWAGNRIDAYNTIFDIVTPFMTAEDYNLPVPFRPVQLEITSDSEEMYIRMAEAAGPGTAIMRLKVEDGHLIDFLRAIEYNMYAMRVRP